MVESAELLDKRDLKKEDEENRVMETIVESDILLNNIKLEQLAERMSELLGIKIKLFQNAEETMVSFSVNKGKSVREIVDLLEKEIGFLHKEEAGSYTLIPKTNKWNNGYYIVRGKVTETDGITGIPGVTLSLVDDVNTLVLSNNNGEFVIYDIAIGRYILIYTAQGYKPGVEIVEINNNEIKNIKLKMSKLNLK